MAESVERSRLWYDISVNAYLLFVLGDDGAREDTIGDVSHVGGAVR